MAQEINTSFAFNKTGSAPLAYSASITFPNKLHTISVNWVEDRNNPGTFRFFKSNLPENWSALEAGIASIYAFLNDANDPELETFIFKKNNNPDIPSSGAGKFYVLEKMLTELSTEDIEAVGRGDLRPHKIKYVFSAPSKRKFDCNVEYLNLKKQNIFFKSLEKDEEKSIAVMYRMGGEYELVKQRIIKTENSKNKSGSIISYCSDWSILTNGNIEKSPVHSMANQVAKNLSLFLDMSEKYIRSARFEELWEMCRSSS